MPGMPCICTGYSSRRACHSFKQQVHARSRRGDDTQGLPPAGALASLHRSNQAEPNTRMEVKAATFRGILRLRHTRSYSSSDRASRWRSKTKRRHDSQPHALPSPVQARPTPRCFRRSRPSHTLALKERAPSTPRTIRQASRFRSSPPRVWLAPMSRSMVSSLPARVADSVVPRSCSRRCSSILFSHRRGSAGKCRIQAAVRLAVGRSPPTGSREAPVSRCRSRKPRGNKRRANASRRSSSACATWRSAGT